MADDTVRSKGLRDWVRTLWRRRLIVLSFALVLPALVFAFSMQQPVVYGATARVIVENSSTTFNAAAGQNLGDKLPDDRQVATLASFVVTPEVANRVNEALGTDTSFRTYHRETVTATPDSAANVINVSATQPTAEQARDLANAFAQQFVEWRRSTQQNLIDEAIDVINGQLADADPGTQSFADLNDRLSQLSVLRALSTGGVEVGDLAQAPQSPGSPRPLRNSVLAFIAGLVLGVGVALLVDALDVKVHSVAEIEALTDIPVIATIPPLSKSRDGISMLSDSRGAVAEAYRFLRTNIDLANFSHDVRSLLITSPLPQQGKSTTVANLALVMLRAGKRVAVVEGDLRRPTLHSQFRVPNQQGVTSVIAGTASVNEAAHHLRLRESGATVTTLSESHATPQTLQAARGVGEDGSLELTLLTSGPLPPNPGEMVASAQLASLVDDLEKDADYVLVDAPPLLAVGDATALASIVDGVIIVVRLGQTTREMIRHVEDFVSRVPARRMGIVVTGVSRAAGGETYRYNAYLD